MLVTNLKGDSGMRLHRVLEIAQESAWHLAHRISEICNPDNALFGGCADVTQLGGRRKNMPNHHRKKLSGRRLTGKTAVVRARDRATNQVAARAVESTDKETLQGFVESIWSPASKSL